jgi:Transposase DDE domain group 1
VLEPVVARYRTTLKQRYFRADAVVASPEIYAFLEAEDYGYVIRLPANAVPQRKIAHLHTRPAGRPPHEVRRLYASFRYQAQSWSHSRRVVEGRVAPGRTLSPARLSGHEPVPLVADDASREGDQDRREGDCLRPLHGLSDG